MKNTRVEKLNLALGLSKIPNVGVVGKDGEILLLKDRTSLSENEPGFRKIIFPNQRDLKPGTIVKVVVFTSEGKPNERYKGHFKANVLALEENHINSCTLSSSPFVSRSAEGKILNVIDEDRVRIELQTQVVYSCLERDFLDSKVSGSKSKSETLTLTRTFPMHLDQKADARIVWPQGQTIGQLITWDPNDEEPEESAPEGQDVYIYLTEENNSPEILEKLYSLIPG